MTYICSFQRLHDTSSRNLKYVSLIVIITDAYIGIITLLDVHGRKIYTKSYLEKIYNTKNINVTKECHYVN